MPVTPKRNVRVDDVLWERLRSQATRHRRDLSTEVRVALEVYAALSERDSAAIKEVLDGADK